MRYDVKKFLFVGHHAALKGFFYQAQNAGLVDFINSRGFKGKELPVDIQHLINAIKVLRGLPDLRQEKPKSNLAAQPIAEKILELSQTIEKLEEEQRITRLEIAREEVFGQFSMEDIRYIEEKGHREVRFYFAKKGRVAAEELSPEILRVASAHGLDYYVSISKAHIDQEHLFPMHFDHELTTLKRRAEEIQWEIHALDEELKTLARYNTFLHQALVRHYNDYNLVTTETYVAKEMEGALFSVEGWVPENKIAKLSAVVEDLDVHIEEIAVEAGEIPPTYLENKGFSRVGEDLINIYDTPSNQDKDPSLWVLLSFALFFAMIIRDGGYGLVFLAAALYYRYKNPKIRNSAKRLWKLGVLLCSFCILWGGLTHSFFGISFAPDSVVKKISVLNWLVEKKASYHFQKKDTVYNEWMAAYPAASKASSHKEFLYGAKVETPGKTSYKIHEAFSDEIMMELALLAGIIHVSLGFLRYLRRNWSGIGWILAIIGCYLFFPKMLEATTMAHYVFGLGRDTAAREGLHLLGAGLSLAVALALIQHKLTGLLEITTMIQIFGDILSYLRLYALGLAGSINSELINGIAASSIFSVAVLLLIVGHGLNMVLALVGGVIHGLRLNFIEWYHYSFEGGGKRFNPLRKLKVE